MKNNSALKDQFDQAKAHITLKQYAEARALLRKIDHPTAQEWLAKLDKLDPPPPIFVGRPYSEVLAESARQNRTSGSRGTRVWRNIWGVLALLSMGWICYGLYASTMAFGQVATPTASKATHAGATIGASLGIGIYLCTGLPFLVIFLYAYSRAGAAIRSERQHQEMLEAINQR